MCFIRVLVIIGCSLVCASAESATPFDALLKKVPGSANALFLIDVQSTGKSPIAIKQGWLQKLEQAYGNRPIYLPPEADYMVLASQWDNNENMTQHYELAVMRMAEPISMRAIARAEAGYLDLINGMDAVWAPSDSYFVGLTQNMMGVMYPANRQLVSRWADFGKSSQEMAVSEYLQGAVRDVSDSTPIVLALDLQDMAQPHRLKPGLEQLDFLKTNSAKIDEIAKTLLGLKGMRLELELKESARGKIHIDFNYSPKNSIGNLAKPLLLAGLEKYQATLPIIEKWDFRISGNSIIGEGRLDQSSLTRIFSLLEIPTTKFSSHKDKQPETTSQESVGQASLAYYKSVTALIEDLNKTLHDTRDNHAVWMERYGKRIDRLPIMNVDEELLDWGAKVAETFRSMGLAVRNSGIRTGVRRSKVYRNYDSVNLSYGNGVNYYYTDRATAKAKDQNAILMEEQSKAKTVRYESWKEIQDESARIRREMTQRYQLEF